MCVFTDFYLFALVTLGFHYAKALRSLETGSQLEPYPCGQHKVCPLLTHNEVFWESKTSTPLCCTKKGQLACCTIFDILKNNGQDGTTVKSDEDSESDSTSISIVSFGIGATVGVVIGLLLLFIGCGVAFHYCCGSQVSNGGYQSSPVITYRQSGLRGRNSHVVSIPLDPNRRGSHFSITISGQGMPTVNYRSSHTNQAHPTVPEDPPKYEDISKVSFPVYQQEMQPLQDADLPSYSSVVGNM